MGPTPDPKKIEEATREQIRTYRALQDVANDENFSTFFDMLIKDVAAKMMYCFEGENIKSYEDFCRAKGEIVARLQPIQEVYSAQFMIEQLETQLQAYKQNQQLTRLCSRD